MENPWRRRVRQSLRIDLCVHFIPVVGSPAVTSCNRFSKAWMTAGSFFFDRLTATTRLAYSVGGILKGLFQVCKTTANRVWAHAGNLSYVFDGSSTRLACQVGNEQASPLFVKGCDHPIDGSMLFSSGTLGRFSTILTGTLANPSMYCSGHNNLPPLRLPREGKLIIPETFKLFPDISLLLGVPQPRRSWLHGLRLSRFEEPGRAGRVPQGFSRLFADGCLCVVRSGGFEIGRPDPTGGLLGPCAPGVLRRPAESAARGTSGAGPDCAVVRHRGRNPAAEPGRAAGRAPTAKRADSRPPGTVLARAASRRVAQEPVWQGDRLCPESLARAPPVHGEWCSGDRQQHFGAYAAAVRDRAKKLDVRGERPWGRDGGDLFQHPGQCQALQDRAVCVCASFIDRPLVGRGGPGVALARRLDRGAPGARPHVPSRRGRGCRERTSSSSCHPPREDPRAHSEPLTGATVVLRLAIPGTSPGGPPARIIRTQRRRTRVRAWSIRRSRAGAIARGDVAPAILARHQCRRGRGTGRGHCMTPRGGADGSGTRQSPSAGRPGQVSRPVGLGTARPPARGYGSKVRLPTSSPFGTVRPGTIPRAGL